jgi:Zinc finger, C3HC4 type (RING finger)
LGQLTFVYKSRYSLSTKINKPLIGGLQFVVVNNAFSIVGNYFGTHFIMGGERFDTPQPEAYLFGENADLNFLGNRPTPVTRMKIITLPQIYINSFQFPYPPPQATEPTKTLKSLVNIRKESVRFVRSPADNGTKIHEDGTGNTPVTATNKQGTSFNIEFTFDSDAKCAITIYYFCVEDIGPAGLTYIPRDPTLTSETIHMKKGANQFFSHSSHIVNPSLYSDEELSYNVDRDVYPIVIHCVIEEGGDNPESRQSHSTICVVDHHTDGSYCLRALKQKIFVDGLCYLLQEIYGIENKNINKCIPDEDTEDNGCECVICMCDVRDTLILPCRHLCLCNSCADSLRYQANNCPICRAPFRALIQIRAVQKTVLGTNGVAQQQAVDSGDNIPDGYMAVSLIEALNGPPPKSQNRTNGLGDGTPASDGNKNKDGDTESTTAAALSKNGRTSPREKSASTDSLRKAAKDLKNGGGQHNQSTEFRMSVLLGKEDGTGGGGGGGNVTKELLAKHSPLMSRAPASRDKNPREKGALRPQPQLPIRDCLKLVNEKKSPNEEEEDSEAEKLSPLLAKGTVVNKNSAATALRVDGVDPIDDTDTDADDPEMELQKVS